MKYDVYCDESTAYTLPHFCKVSDLNEEGEMQECNGTHPMHGMGWEQARMWMAQYYRAVADSWSTREEPDAAS